MENSQREAILRQTAERKLQPSLEEHLISLNKCSLLMVRFWVVLKESVKAFGQSYFLFFIEIKKIRDSSIPQCSMNCTLLIRLEVNNHWIFTRKTVKDLSLACYANKRCSFPKRGDSVLKLSHTNISFFSDSTGLTKPQQEILLVPSFMLVKKYTK